MTDSGLTIRALDPERELDEFLDVAGQGLVSPIGPEQWRAREQLESGSFRRYLVGVQRGRIVAAASIFDHDSLDEGVIARLTVAEDCRGRGHGRALFAVMAPLVAERDPAVVEARVVDDDASSRAWAERRGFVVADHTIRSRLEAGAFDPAAHEPALASVAASGLRIEPPAIDEDRLYELYTTLVRDVPDNLDPPDREFFRKHMAIPGVLCLVATDGDRGVGMTVIEPVVPDGGHVGFTGVLPEYRGRHLARAMKAMASRLALDRGMRWITAVNNATNAPMLAVNRALGYRRLMGVLSMRRRRRP
jgi:ribosomal protein S18 acetylase RimI-like enzyme